MSTILGFSIGDSSKGSINVSQFNNSFVLLYPCSSPYDCTFYETTFSPGLYELEVWGGQGGNRIYEGGRGGYSRGLLSVSNNTRVFITLGGQPETFNDSNFISITGGFNGGGGSVSTSNCNGGGGGTDIRLYENTLYHRVIVAGGGGGGTSGSAALYAPGAGGGIEGQASKYGPTTNGGKQNSGGTGGYTGSYGTQGVFGLGGTHGHQSGGGGGGWYGGSGSGNGGHITGGAGGSGYVFNSSSFKPPGFMLDSSVFLSDGETIQGTNNIYLPTGVVSQGNIGHGSARITVLSITSSPSSFIPRNTICINHPTIFFSFSIYIMIFTA